MARTGAEGGQGDRRVQGLCSGRGCVEGVEGVSACLQAVQGGDRGRGLLLRAEWLGQRGRSLRGPLLQRGFAVSLASCGLPDAHGNLLGAPGLGRGRSEEASWAKGQDPVPLWSQALSPGHSPWLDRGQPSNVTSGPGGALGGGAEEGLPGEGLGCGSQEGVWAAPTTSASREGTRDGDGVRSALWLV